jgi:acyl-CoA reductase-like NAD-dependent aldehyde dehydrogenase
VENPKNGEIMGVVAEGDKADIDAAVAVAQQAFGQWSEFSGRERGDIMESAAQILHRRLPEFVAIEVEQIGRPCRGMAAQLARAPGWFSYFGRGRAPMKIPFLCSAGAISITPGAFLSGWWAF